MDVDGILNHIQAAVDLLEIKEFVPRSSRRSKGTVQGAFPTRNKFFINRQPY